MKLRYPKNMQTRNGDYTVVSIIDGYNSKYGESVLAVLKRKEDGKHESAAYFERDGQLFYYRAFNECGMDIVEVKPESEKLYAWDIKNSAGEWFRIDQYLTEKEASKRFPLGLGFGYVARVRGPEFVPPAESNNR